MSERGSGILLSITSLPSPFGIGDLGPSAYRFVEFLQKAGQKYWQILPLNPICPDRNNSPYLSASAFAGNTLLISPELMERDGFLGQRDLEEAPVFLSGRVDYPAVLDYKRKIFTSSYEQMGNGLQDKQDYLSFCKENDWWLDDYALFSGVSDHYAGRSWDTWPAPIKDRDQDTLSEYGNRFAEEIEREKFLQYLFFRQWHALRRYCNRMGIRILGDLPIYVNFDSADVWAHPSLFQLNESCRPSVVAGVPPDYFSRTGQIWKNPLYRWEEHERTGFAWWIDRFRHNFTLFDLVRLDHFRGLVAYYEIPADAIDATGGRWVKAPAKSFFRIIKERFPVFPVIAEDLGVITPDVLEIMRTYGLPGMRVLQFAFTDETSLNPHAPHNLKNALFFYTGTHDNAPTRSWFEHHASADDKRRLSQYLGNEWLPEELPEVFIRQVMMSVADTCIIPLQDILALGDDSRMNTPGTERGNWEWRVTQDQMQEETKRHLRDLTGIYGRL